MSPGPVSWDRLRDRQVREEAKQIDEYQQRFRQLRDAQVAWVREHNTTITRYCPICRGGCELGPQTPERPHRVPAEDLNAARDAVRHSVRRFLVRLYQAGFVSEAEVREAAAIVGATIDAEDLETDHLAR